jgi:glyoxylase-like metal-dependent hydrolase (beta-lactamase superfamily II)
MNVIPLPEGTFTVDLSKKFLPFSPQTDNLSDRPASLVVDVVPFLIQSAGDCVVVDPGLGFQNADGEFMIHAAVQRHGISPDDVSIVLLSHLHKDHIGGIAYGKDGAYNLMFPNATVFCQEKELGFAFSRRESSSFDFDKLEFLARSPRLKFLNDDGVLNAQIRCEVSGGHTPYHQVFLFTSDEEVWFFGGDVVPQPSQLIRRFAAKYDFDGKRSARLRREYAMRGAEGHWTFLFFHDARTPMARVKHEQHRFQIVK